MHAAGIDTERGQRRAIVRILHQHRRTLVVEQHPHQRRRAASRIAFASGLCEVNTKPSPASAFTRITGSPRAASEPITAGCNAT